MSAFNLNPAEFPAIWASAWGQDKQGYWQALKLNGVEQIMRWILPGNFQMGSPQTEAERFDNENLHQVTLSQGYWLAETACSQRLWMAVMGENPSIFDKNLENPVDSVSWLDCQGFFTAANALLPEGFSLRFPMEAEWEYACRAGSTTAFSWGDALTTERANYDGDYPYNKGQKGEYRESTVEVLKFSANLWGLYQMHGNVYEWCSDWFSKQLTKDEIDPQGVSEGQFRVLRGGGWSNRGRFLRSAYRSAYQPVARNHYVGFRLAGG